MTTDDVAIRQFVEAYIDDASAIQFAWNGRHEEQFEDANEFFRDAVIDYVMEHPKRAPLSLLVDLYRALTDYSTEAWCINERVEVIGKLMLANGRATVARDYIDGARKTFDAMIATSFTGCPRDVAEECLELAQSNLKTTETGEEKEFWTTAVDRFELLLKFAE